MSRRWLLVTIYLAVGLAVYVVLLRQASLAGIRDALLGAQPLRLALCLGLGLATTALRAARLRTLLAIRGGRVELYGILAWIRLLRFALPFQSGEVVAMLLLKRRGLTPSLAELAPAWMLLRLADLGALGLLMMLTLTWIGFESPARWVGVLLLALSTALVAALAGMGRWVPRLSRGRLGRSAWLRSRLERFTAGAAQLGDRRVLLPTVGWSLAVWTLMIATVVAAQAAVGTPLAWERNVASSAAVLGLSLLPVHAPLGIGTQDAAWYGVLLAAGVPAEAAGPFALSARLLLVAVVLLDGLLGITLLAVLPPRRRA